MKILFVEDDQSTNKFLTAALSADQYVVDLATDGESALDFAEQWEYDLILLDWQLPKLDGIQVCQRIRARGNKTPILMLTSRNCDEDVVAGLDAGADDYVIKPCNVKQLLARIRALLRRKDICPTPILSWGALSLDPVAARVTHFQQEIQLRPKEFMLLRLLMLYPQRIFSRSDIIDHLWTADNFPTEGAVTNLIKDLRGALANAGLPHNIIETRYGIGYRLKEPPERKSPTRHSSQSEEEKTSPQNLQLGLEPSAMEQMGEKYQELTQQRLSQLEETAQLLLKGQLEDDQHQIAKTEAHRLAGNLGMYGYRRASEIARSLDRLLSEDTTTVQNQAVQFREWFLELQQELKKKAPVLSARQSESSPLVLVISDDDYWAEALQQECYKWNLRVEVIPDLSPTQRKLILEPPAAIVLELGITDSDGDRFDTLREVKQYYPDIPVFTLAAQDDLMSRVVVSRLGSERYLTKPITATKLLREIAQRLPSRQPNPHVRVLIVDDDPTIHPILTQALQPWGVEVISLMEPEQFWQVLTQTNPDLVLLDIEMPTFNGLELCRVVRQGTQYAELPILVITVETKPECIQQVFDAGADDLLRKPIIESELVTRVLHRIERSRLRQQFELLHRQTQHLYQQATVDALTQTANRRAFDEFLQQSWQQLQRGKAPLSLILCDIDQFKLYNDQYGHPSGDSCLKRIASTLERCVRPEIDLVARYSGEEFAIVLPNTSLSAAISVVERIQTAITQLKIPHNDRANFPYITLSIGVTGTVPTADKSIAKLITTADRALYAAKEQGRNTYCLYSL
jgi:diguanylate cyclase (GGDEF)-like protein